MIKKVLENIAYLYYPKNICAWTERDKLIASDEYKKLRSLIDSFDTEESIRERKVLTDEFEQDYTLKEFQDFSKLDHWEDRCLTFFLNVIENGELKSINLYISFLVPYYVIQTITHKNQMVIPQSKIDELEKNSSETRKIDELVLEVEKIVENKLSYQKFPKELLNVVLEDISFQDSYLGEFKMFNAFFNNQSVRE
ncbi:hypothetical protein [Flavobacterium sp. ov086]|uniref:hypothetical protein n=1 Tax=Flavobacterium sp. ov086 TaxID=1761785 RepID=UPI000B702232|nr:hypothetical protein [Flavobacterium sp. ov086]SNR83427.1 hypothetical protein SAMN04487979_12415 [Flavobacterium sp. ov086]